MSPKELYDHICSTIDGADIDPRRPCDTFEAIFNAGACLCAAGLRDLDAATRERLLEELEPRIRMTLRAWAERGGASFHWVQ